MSKAKARVTPSLRSPGVTIWSSAHAAPYPKASSARKVKGYKSGGESTTLHLEGDVDRANQRLEERKSRLRNPSYRPTGPALAEDIFRTNWGEVSAECESEEDYEAKSPESDFGWAYQPSLELESTIELEERLQRSIRQYETAYDAMCLAALRWHQLMEDVHHNAQVKKMFLDMQMVRKLSGYDSH